MRAFCAPLHRMGPASGPLACLRTVYAAQRAAPLLSRGSLCTFPRFFFRSSLPALLLNVLARDLRSPPHIACTARLTFCATSTRSAFL
jgi:hypothetical protein